MSPRDHPPTFLGAAMALLSSLAADLQAPLSNIGFLSDTSASLALALASGVVGGLAGRLSQHWTVPFRYNADDGPGPGPDTTLGDEA